MSRAFNNHIMVAEMNLIRCGIFATEILKTVMSIRMISLGDAIPPSNLKRWLSWFKIFSNA